MSCGVQKSARAKRALESNSLSALERRAFGRSLRAGGRLLAAGLMLTSSACMVGPNYKRPTAEVPAAFKEPPTDNPDEINRWKPAQPNEAAVRGKWWEIYNDPQLNALEEQVSISNQNVLLAAAQFREAADAVRIARSALFPTITTSPSYTRSSSSSTLFNASLGNLTSGQRNTYDLPASISYTADLWGSIRRTVRAGAATAQASFAQLENARLSYQATLADDYFELHGTDGDAELLQTTVKSYQEYLKLTQDRFSSGVASGGDVAQAETQLDAAQAQLIDYGIARAQFEHAIAILTGKPPSEVTISAAPIKIVPPSVPVSVPSTLLERRPDIAAAERQMAAENEQIGIAKAAYYPSLTLGATGGLESGQFYNWFTWPSRFWSIGPAFAETLFDAGRRHAQVAEARDTYDATVASYRQTVLTSFQQVEDNLAALRVLENEARSEDAAVKAAQDALDIATYQYKAGTVNYLSVITEQAILLTDQVAAVNILTRRMSASVLLVEALGGGWDTSHLPSQTDLIHGK
ncbi:MAG TPA: efflux transporter outer membrane subunit [Terriglobia bacterium]|nr:efflux transporter outer membrane subunit [Terriglobia bacterium]